MLRRACWQWWADQIPPAGWSALLPAWPATAAGRCMEANLASWWWLCRWWWDKKINGKNTRAERMQDAQRILKEGQRWPS